MRGFGLALEMQRQCRVRTEGMMGAKRMCLVVFDRLVSEQKKTFPCSPRVGATALLR